MTMLVARYSMNISRFLAHHPRRWTSLEQTPICERQLVWELCIKLLEQHNMALTNPQLKQFAWHAAYFQQWHVIIHVLDTLQTDPTISGADKAWRLIESTYENTPAMAVDWEKAYSCSRG